ncbi:MAG TPA: NAD(P)-dependent oxidoreductase [Solirubrobacteraceae bacterium]|nr:NAD(P)-dependent oxidoreductase [Solirubrobacteraceae bacterium]
MSRVLVTGGAGTIGTAIVRLLLADPAYDVRVSDTRAVPLWMREGCELHTGDLRLPVQARAATKGCSHVIHLAMAPGAIGAAQAHPYTTIEHEAALHGAVVRAALEREVERFVYVSSPLVFERAELFPTPEEHLIECPTPRSPAGFSRLGGERECEAASREHGLPYVICRPFGSYGIPATDERESSTEALVAGLIEAALAGTRTELALGDSQTCTPTHAGDIAAGIVLALGSAGALHEDFNLGAPRELTSRELARLVWESCGADPNELVLERHAPEDRAVERDGALGRSVPAVEKARELLAWEAQTDLEEGLAATVQALREQRVATRAATLAA